MYTFRGYYIPERMMGGIERYLEHGIEPGSFLTAVIHNNLAEAVGCADEENMANLPAYVAFFHNEAPSTSWGSEERMQQWIKARREVSV